MNRRGFIAGTLAVLGAWKLKLPWSSPAPATVLPVAAQTWVWQAAFPDELTEITASEWKSYELVFTLTKSPDGGNLMETKWVESEKTPLLPAPESANYAKDTKAQTISAFPVGVRKDLDS